MAIVFQSGDFEGCGCALVIVGTLAIIGSWKLVELVIWAFSHLHWS